MTDGELRLHKQWAADIRTIPGRYRAVVGKLSDEALRFRPRDRDWSAIEIVGHMCDKVKSWHKRAERIFDLAQPFLPGFDQDARVREQGYQRAALPLLLGDLYHACEGFAAFIEHLPAGAAARVGIHSERGPITLRQCVDETLSGANAHLEQLSKTLAAYTESLKAK